MVSCTGRDGSPDTASSEIAETANVPPLAAVDNTAPRFPPRDEADAAFRSWREHALVALARRDTAFLYGILSPVIKIGFGPEGGIDDFRTMWKTDSPSSAVWATLTRVLRMGGQRTSDSTFTAPYVYAFWPDSLDAFVHVAVTGTDAVVRVRPDERADALGTATHSILRLLAWSGVPTEPSTPDTSWARVELPDKRPGWVRWADVFSPVSWRAAFIRRGDRWIMLMLVAGD
jgi:hypothetical protein